jgi:alpha-methylacyl-CoA racemase
VYECADGRHLAVGPLEPKFWAVFAARLGLPVDADPDDRAGWPALRAQLAERLATRTRDDWVAHFEGSDACVAPVLSLTEAAGNSHPQLAARETFVTSHGVRQPAAAPRFTGAPTAPGGPPPRPGEHTRAALGDWGITDINHLLAAGVLTQQEPGT